MPPAASRGAPSPPPERTGAKAFGSSLRSIISGGRALLALLLGKARDDGLSLKSDALAFVTLTSLIPLLAAFSFVGAKVIDQYEETISQALAELLPYSEATIVDQIQLWVAQAESLKALGTAVFVLIALSGFVTIEEAINKIWLVGPRRTLRSKLLSFTLLIFWGPIVIGSSYSVLLLLRQRPGFDTFLDQGILAEILPFLVTLVGLSMLYWQVPFTYVGFHHALRGGVFASTLLELLRRGFAYWVSNFPQWSYVVYGGVALAFLFMVAIKLAWWVVLLGSEVAYVSQHADTMRLSRGGDDRLPLPWLGLALLTELATSLRRGVPLCTVEELSRHLGVFPETVKRALDPLIDDGLVAPVPDDPGRLALACDPSQMAVTDVLSVYDAQLSALVERLPEGVASPVREVAHQALAGRRDALDGRRLIDLLPGESQDPADD